MFNLPPVIHVSSGKEDPPDRSLKRDPYFPYLHINEAMFALFSRGYLYAESREITEKEWSQYHERDLTQEEIDSLDEIQEGWENAQFPYDTPMALLQEQIDLLNKFGWSDHINSGSPDQEMVDYAAGLWKRYKGEDLCQEDLDFLLGMMTNSDRPLYPENFEWTRPVAYLESLLQQGELEMIMEKRFWHPELTTQGEDETVITAHFSVDEKDKLELAEKMWFQMRGRRFTQEEYDECIELFVHHGLMEAPKPPPPVTTPKSPEDGPLDLPPTPEDTKPQEASESPQETANEEAEEAEESQEDKSEDQPYVIETWELSKIKQTAKDVYEGTSNFWTNPEEIDGMCGLILGMMKIANYQDIGAIIGSGKMGGRVTSHNGGPKRHSCSNVSLMHRSDVKTFIREFNKIVEFMDEFKAPEPETPWKEGDKKPWEKVTITIRPKEEQEEE